MTNIVNEMKMTSMRNIQDTSSNSSANTMTNPNSSSHPSQGPSQEELIRLLAQHLNLQFYQLAQSGTNGTNNGSNTGDLSSILQTANITSGSSNNFSLHHSIAQYQQQLQQQQQQQQQYIINQDSVNFSSASRVGAADLGSATLNLAQANSNEKPFLANQVFGSHQQQQQQQSAQSPASITPTSSNKSMGGPGAGQGMEFVSAPLFDDSLVPMMQNNLQSPTAIRLNDMNLFNALNLTNDQFVLSLQQQYLLQAASTANQYRLKDHNTVDSLNHLQHPHHTRHTHIQHLNQRQQQHHHHQQQQQQQQQQQLNHHPNQHQQQQQGTLRIRRNQVGAKHSSKGLLEFNNAQCENRKELKFSINTILGRGSPMPTSSALQLARTESPDNTDGKLLVNNDKFVPARTSKQTKDDGENHQQQQQQLSSPECDQNITTDFGSDSSDSTMTPTPQSDAMPGSSIAFDPYIQTRGRLPSDHPSAANLTNQVTGIQQMAAADKSRSMSLNQHPGDHHAALSFLTGTATFPWTVAARGKPRRGMMRRAVFSDGQRVGLEKRFQLQKYISKPDRKKLAEKLGLRDSQVKIWFQNRRMKWRNSKERELLSAGGSREQTLPTRNNPNPDLSDVGETVKKLAANSNGNSAV